MISDQMAHAQYLYFLRISQTLSVVYCKNIQTSYCGPLDISELVSPQNLRCRSTSYSPVQENIRCYRSLDATVIRAWRSFDLRSNGIRAVFVLVSSGRTLLGLFCKNHSNHRGGVGSQIQRLRRACITKASKVWQHMIFLHTGEYDVLLHLRCYGDTSFEVVGYGIKGHLSSFCTNCVQFSNSSRFPAKILRHIM